MVVRKLNRNASRQRLAYDRNEELMGSLLCATLEVQRVERQTTHYTKNDGATPIRIHLQRNEAKCFLDDDVNPCTSLGFVPLDQFSCVRSATSTATQIPVVQ